MYDHPLDLAMYMYICMCFDSIQLDLGDLRPRSWHIAQPYYCHPHSTECRVVIFGGNVHTHASQCSGDRVNTADLKILAFGKQLIICYYMYSST